MAGKFQSLTGGEIQSVNVSDLEAELSALWRSAAEDPEVRHAVTRSCALTLFVYVETEEAGREVLDLMDEVAAQNPCRAIIMIAEPEAGPAGLSAQISARCHLAAAGAKEVCSEQVSVRARGEAVNGLDQVVIPLLVPGLPVYFWWRSGRFSPPEFLLPILRACDHVLVDSSRFPSPEKDLLSLYQFIRSWSGQVVFTDLNWTRLTPWRELIAQCFDPAEARAYLDELYEVRIEYEGDSTRVLAHRAQSLLLTGWLASRLNWQPRAGDGGTSNTGDVLHFRSGQGFVEVHRSARHFEGGGAGCHVSLSMKAGRGSTAAFTLVRGRDGRTVSTRSEIPGRPPLERNVRLEIAGEVELLNGEIRFAARDRIYEESLGMVARSLASSSQPH